MSMVLLLFDFIEAERETNWDIHLKCFKQMLPCDRAFDLTKYFKSGLIFVIDMLRLPQEAPEVYTAFKEGNHSVSRSKTVSTFNHVSTDMALEQDLNRDSKMKGGIIGVSHDENAVEEWTAHLRAAVTSNFSMMSELRKNEQLSFCKDLRPVTVTKTDKQVQSLSDGLDRMMDPFHLKDFSENDDTEAIPLINIATGVVLPDDMSLSLLTAKDTGEALMTDFLENKLDSTTKFSDSLKRADTKTFSFSFNKKVKVSSQKAGERVLRSDWKLFSRLLIASRKRDFDLKNLLSYELSPVPLSISTLSGNMRKTAKSKLLAELEIDTNRVKALLDYSNSSAYIIDFIAILQTAKKGKLATFSDLSDALSEQVLPAFKFGNIVSVVPDRYEIEPSSKSDERKRHPKTHVAERKLSWRNEASIKHASVSDELKNKIHIVNFILDDWMKRFQTLLRENQQLVIALLNGNTVVVGRGMTMDTNVTLVRC